MKCNCHKIPGLTSLSKDICDFCLTSFPSVPNYASRNTLSKEYNRKLMKDINSGSCLSVLVLAAGLFAAILPAAGQSTLIVIDINEANPSAVQFTAVGSNSLANSSMNNLFGVDLLSYFTSAHTSIAGAVAGTLVPAGTTTAYNAWFPDSLNTAHTNVDLNLYVTTTSQVQTFSTSSPAFTGTATIDLSSWLAFLPRTGTTNYVLAGNSRSSLGAIGGWIVVPEAPVEAQLALGAMVFAGFALIRRVRRIAARR